MTPAATNRLQTRMIRTARSLSILSLGFTLATVAAVNPAMHDAEGAGKAFLPDARPVIRFDTTAYIESDLAELSVVSEPINHILLERRVEATSPVSAAGLNRPLIPLIETGRQQHTLEITGTNLNPMSVRLADFPDGARMAAVQSRDDGIPQDKRAAELLQKWGWRASFFSTGILRWSIVGRISKTLAWKSAPTPGATPSFRCNHRHAVAMKAC